MEISWVNTTRLIVNGCNFADNIFKFLKWKMYFFIPISLKRRQVIYICVSLGLNELIIIKCLPAAHKFYHYSSFRYPNSHNTRSCKGTGDGFIFILRFNKFLFTMGPLLPFLCVLPIQLNWTNTFKLFLHDAVGNISWWSGDAKNKLTGKGQMRGIFMSSKSALFPTFIIAVLYKISQYLGLFGSGHESAAVLLPGFAIIW